MKEPIWRFLSKSKSRT